MMGWGKLLTGPTSIRYVPTKHDDIFDKPQVSILADHLIESLTAIQTEK
jgi:hypothetical protein